MFWIQIYPILWKNTYFLPKNVIFAKNNRLQTCNNLIFCNLLGILHKIIPVFSFDNTRFCAYNSKRTPKKAYFPIALCRNKGVI